MPIEAVRKKLFDYEALKLIRHNGKEKWKPKGRIKLLNNDDLEILNVYNAEVRGFATTIRSPTTVPLCTPLDILWNIACTKLSEESIALILDG